MKGRILTGSGVAPVSFAKKLDYISRGNSAIMVSQNMDGRSDYASQMNAAVGRGTGRVRNPLLHFEISWPKKGVTRREARRAINHCIEVLGALGCQWVAALHQDTGNDHCHVILNRVRPDDGRAWTASFSKLKLNRACRELESEASQTNSKAPATRAADFEAYSGMMSLITWARETVLPQYIEKMRRRNIESWHDLHCFLATTGLEYDQHGTLGDMTGKRPIHVKANAISKLLNVETLGRRLGPYVARRASVIVSTNGYGNARALYKIPTERVRHPNVMPVFERWVRERRAFEDDCKAIRATRGRLRQAAEEQYNRIKAQAAEARQLILEIVEVAKHRQGMRMLISEMVEYERMRTKRELKIGLEEVARRTLPNHFLSWLKDQASHRDPEVQRAIATLREAAGVSDKVQRPTTALASDLYAEYAAAAAYQYAVADEVIITNFVGSVDVGVLDVSLTSLERSIRETYRALPEEEFEGARELYDSIIRRIPEEQRTDARAVLVARAASILPVALRYYQYGLDSETIVLSKPIVALDPRALSLEELSSIIDATVTRTVDTSQQSGLSRSVIRNGERT
jgi:hypothetical protein